MKQLLLLLFIFFFLTGIAQERKAVVKFLPFSLADDVSFPTIQAGLEFPLSEHIGWYNEAGIKYRKGYYEMPDTSFIHSKGFKTKTEFRYYFNKKGYRQPQGNYAAVNFFYNRDLHNTGINYYAAQDTSVKREDDFAVKKSAWGINFLIGKQKAVGKKIMVDCYFGVGIRFRQVTTFNKEFNEGRDRLIKAVDITIAGIRDQVDSDGGNSVAPNFTMGIRFCYGF